MENSLIDGRYCPNCGHRTESNDKFCAQCGQSTKNTRISLGEFINDSLSGFFSMDSKVVNSIVPLLTKPGFLSNEFLKGRRQQYITPVRLYLTISILYFFILASGHKFEKLSSLVSGATPEKTEVADSITQKNNTDEESDFLRINFGERDSTLHSSKTLSDEEEINLAIDDLLTSFDEDEAEDDVWHQYLKEETQKVAKDPNAFIRYFRDKLSIFFFLTLPFFALFLKILYFRHKFTYIEHLIFIFHTQSVLFLLLLIVHFLGFISDGITWIAIVLYLIYALMAIKNFYKQSWLKTVFKYTIISICFTTISILTVTAATILLFLSY